MIMDVKVLFDKEYYFPGETINADVSMQGNVNSSVRKIQIKLFGRETVTFKYQSGEYQSTASEEVYFYSNKVVIQPVQDLVNYRGKISITTPIDVVESYQSDIAKVFHGIEIELDKKWKLDQRFSYPTIVKRTYNQEVKPIKKETKFVTFDLPQNIYSSGALIKYRYFMNLYEGFRGLRLELHQSTLGNAHGHAYRKSKRISTKIINQEINEPYLLPQGAKSIKGKNFQVSYFLRFIVDRAFKRDYRLDIPIVIEEKDEGFCPSCGAQITGDFYCIECGNKL